MKKIDWIGVAAIAYLIFCFVCWIGLFIALWKHDPSLATLQLVLTLLVGFVIVILAEYE